MKTVLLFGDSNTHGTCPMTGPGDRRRHEADVRWPGLVAAALPDVRIIDEGHPGRTTVHDDPVEGPHKNGLSVLLSLLESHRPIDLVVVMLGTNDLKARFGVGGQEIALSVDRLLGVVATSGAGGDGGAPKMLVAAPPPIMETGWLAEMFAGGAAKSKDWAPHFRRVALGRKAGFIDAGEHISVDPIDGIHYNAETHRVLGAAMTDAIREALG